MTNLTVPGQGKAGFFVVVDIEPLNVCTFCPDGSDPAI
jgi:hypothetical protein